MSDLFSKVESMRKQVSDREAERAKAKQQQAAENRARMPQVAAWVVWVPGPKGGIVPLPRSVSYAKADQAEFEKYHAAVMNFLRGQYAAPYLWKHLGEKSHDMMNTILDSFGE